MNIKKNEDLCQVSKCRNEAALFYYEKGVCESHWNRYCAGKFKLKEKLKIKEKE